MRSDPACSCLTPTRGTLIQVAHCDALRPVIRADSISSRALGRASLFIIMGTGIGRAGPWLNVSLARPLHFACALPLIIQACALGELGATLVIGSESCLAALVISCRSSATLLGTLAYFNK